MKEGWGYNTAMGGTKILLLDVNTCSTGQQELKALLWPERIERMEQLSGAAALRCLAGGLLLRYGLSRDDCCGIRYQQQGKPYVPSGACFNLSHSGDIAALGISDSPIGIDIEQWRAADYLRLGKRIFHPHELECFKNTGGDEAAFFQLWTAKESYLKALGCGLTAGLKYDCCGDISPWKICYPQCRENYSLACCHQSDEPPELRWLGIDDILSVGER